ncbi:MAG: hypothetical protein WAZ34_05725 [Rhodocyclaceae bacterium]
MKASRQSVDRLLRWSLLAGAAYFALVALAHTFGLKLPGLFIYFDLPSYAYQDQIIGFLCFGWSALFFAAAREPQAARPLVAAVLVVGLAALVGLARINAGTDFASLTGAPQTGAYWLGCAAGLAYWTWLLGLFVRMRND